MKVVFLIYEDMITNSCLALNQKSTRKQNV